MTGNVPFADTAALLRLYRYLRTRGGGARPLRVLVARELIARGAL